MTIEAVFRADPIKQNRTKQIPKSFKGLTDLGKNKEGLN